MPSSARTQKRAPCRRRRRGGERSALSGRGKGTCSLIGSMLLDIRFPAPSDGPMAGPGSLDYQNPLVERYASREMVENFSTHRRYRTWRELWITLAECEAELGLPIRPEEIEELRRRRDDI